MSYFTGISTADEAKGRYRDLVKQHHPDIGGDTDTMQAINAEWEMFRESIAATPMQMRHQAPHYPPTLILQQIDRMIAALLAEGRALVPDTHVYHRRSSDGNIEYRYICIVVPAGHEARARLLAAGYKRHSAWKCWRKHFREFNACTRWGDWVRGKCVDVPFPDVAELEAAA